MSWILFALMAALFASVREISAKRALKEEHALEFLVVRGIFMIAMSLLLIPQVNFNIPLKGYFLVMIVAVLSFFAQILKNKSIRHSELSSASPLMNLIPLFVMIIAFTFLGEKVTLLQAGGILLLVSGTYILEGSRKRDLLGPIKKMFQSKYVAMLLLAILIFSITTTLDRYILTNFIDNIFTYFFLVFNTFNLLFILYHASKFRLKNIGTIIRNHGGKTFVPALAQLLFILTFYQAISMAYASFVIAIVRLQSIIVTIEGGLFFHEDHIMKKGIACVIMTAGAILMVI